MKKKAKAAAEATTDADENAVENGVTNGVHTSTAAADDAIEEETADGDAESAAKKKKKKKKGKGLKQTEPPTVPIAKFFPDGKYPEGEWQSYNDRCVPGNQVRDRCPSIGLPLLDGSLLGIFAASHSMML
jgi:hypothetical protein